MKTSKANMTAKEQAAQQLAACVATNPRAEWLVVSAYLEKNNACLRDRDPREIELRKKLQAMGNVSLNSKKGKTALLAALEA